MHRISGPLVSSTLLFQCGMMVPAAVPDDVRPSHQAAGPRKFTHSRRAYETMPRTLWKLKSQNR